MNMNKFFAYIFTVCTFFLLFSCKNPKSNFDKSITFDSIIVSKQIPLIDNNDTTLPFSQVDIRFIYPVKFGSDEDTKRLQQIFIGTFLNDVSYDSLTPKEAIDKFVTDYTEEYRSLSNDFYSDMQRLGDGNIPSWYWYQLQNTNHILFQNDSLLSYAVEYSDYTGGAHGSYRILYYNIDLNNIVTLSEEDLFIPNFKKPLSNILVQSLMKQYNVTTPDSLLQHGFFTLEDIVPNNNFWMDDKGIHYTFNQYEIAPYVMGAIDVDIPYAELEHLLKEDNVVKRFFTKK